MPEFSRLEREIGIFLWDGGSTIVLCAVMMTSRDDDDRIVRSFQYMAMYVDADLPV